MGSLPGPRPVTNADVTTDVISSFYAYIGLLLHSEKLTGDEQAQRLVRWMASVNISVLSVILFPNSTPVLPDT